MTTLPSFIALGRPVKTHGPRVLTGYTFHGWETVFLENETLRVSILAGRGGMLYEMTYKPKDIDVLYKAPTPVRQFGERIPDLLPESPQSEYNLGGWFECFPSASLAANYKGAKQGFHGELWGTPCAVEAVTEDAEEASVTLTAVMLKAPLRLVRRFSLPRGKAELRIQETVENIGEQDWEVLWGQHPMFGPPFIGDDCLIETPATRYRVWNAEQSAPSKPFPWPAKSKKGEDLRRVRPKASREGKMFFLTDFRDKKGWFRIVGKRSGLSVSMAWDGVRFPWLWLYENAGSLDAPTFGRAHCLALEPFTGLPKGLETQKGLLPIPAGSEVSVEFTTKIEEI
jgi:galactose mutarotase-like enzyme